MNLKTRWPPILAALVVALVVILGYVVPLPWTGLATQSTAGRTYKTLWDWFDLLIVPAALAGLGFLLSRIEKRTELASAEARARAGALQSYLDQMSVLLVDKALLDSAEDSPLRVVARARTLTVLRRQDGAGRGLVLQFLYESQLIGGGFIEDRRLGAVIDLAGADLRDVDGDGLKLCGVVLTKADLSGASLRGADLTGAMLNQTTMRGADITPAYPSYTEDYRFVPSLIRANLQAADLTGARVEATFEGARLDGATLTQADLTRSYFAGVQLRNAKMKGANLRGAQKLDRASLVMAETLEGVILQDGSNALAPQKLISNIDRQVTDRGTTQPAHVVGEASGDMNVLPAEGGGGHIVGLRLSFYHHGVDEGPGLLVTDHERSDQWVSESYPGWQTLTIPARTDVVAAELELPVKSRTSSENRSLLLTFELALEATGRLKSWSLLDASFS
jgi:uncharacterized protein YjbI with pentapeptide repeats